MHSESGPSVENLLKTCFKTRLPIICNDRDRSSNCSPCLFSSRGKLSKKPNESKGPLQGAHTKKDSAARIINSGLTIQTQDLSAQIRMKTDRRRGLGRWSSVRMNDLSLEFRTTLKEKKTRCGSIQELGGA